MNYFLNAIKNHYADFSGRARRSEYWYFTLFNALVGLALMIFIIALFFISDTLGMIGYFAYVVYAFGLFVPGLAVAVRRLHDTNKSGWMMLIAFIPLVGAIILLVFLCTDSDSGVNTYGPNPKVDNYNVVDHLVE